MRTARVTDALEGRGRSIHSDAPPGLASDTHVHEYKRVRPLDLGERRDQRSTHVAFAGFFYDTLKERRAVIFTRRPRTIASVKHLAIPHEMQAICGKRLARHAFSTETQH